MSEVKHQQTYQQERQQTGAEQVTEWIKDKFFLGMDIGDYIKNLYSSKFNIITGIIVLIGFFFIALRFIFGLESVTEASNEQPWGLLLGVGLFTGVPFSASGFVIGTAVHIFGLRKYTPIVKNAILLGFLGYLFAVIFLMIDLGRPWRIYYPMFISFGTASVMFLVAWHVALYLSVQALEFSPSAFEWINFKALRKWVLNITLILTVFGVMLSTLHQSALGAMFLLAPGKVHPLWYTSYIPWLHFISSIGAAIVYVIVVTKLTTMFLRHRADYDYLYNLDNITMGLGKAASFVFLTYLGLRLASVTHEGAWKYLNTSYGYWFLVEISMFAILPVFLYYGVYKRNIGLVQVSALLGMIAVILNRLNISIITFNWQLPHRELFYWKEVIIVIAVLTIEILLYRWIVNRMPVLRQHPDYKGEH